MNFLDALPAFDPVFPCRSALACTEKLPSLLRAHEFMLPPVLGPPYI